MHGGEQGGRQEAKQMRVRGGGACQYTCSRGQLDTYMNVSEKVAFECRGEVEISCVPGRWRWSYSYHLKTQFMFGAEKSRCIGAHPHWCIHVGRVCSSSIHTMGLSCLETIIIRNSWFERCRIVWIMLCSVAVTRVGCFTVLSVDVDTWGRLLMETVQLDMLLQRRSSPCLYKCNVCVNVIQLRYCVCVGEQMCRCAPQKLHLIWMLECGD